MCDPYYMAILDDILERVGSNTALSKLDLAKGYYQVLQRHLASLHLHACH